MQAEDDMEDIEVRPFKRVMNGKEVMSGLCSGLAYAYGWNINMVRCFAVLLMVALSFGPFILAYLICAMCVPRWDKLPEDYEERAENS